MNTTTQTKARLADSDAVVEFLLYSWNKRYVTLDALKQGTNLPARRLSHAVRVIVASYGAMEYSRRGEYLIVDLERYFECPTPGANDRYHQPLLDA